MTVLENDHVMSAGHQLEISADTFGELRDSSRLVRDGAALRELMAEDGYLFMRGLMRRENVLAARLGIMERLAADGILRPGSDPIEGLANGAGQGAFRPDLTVGCEPLQRLLYTGAIMEFYDTLFGEPALHYDFTWLRAVAPGQGTRPHCDVVYMGRAERERLYTAWIPLGDAPLKLGGLTILENSHRQREFLKPYLERDVDSYCTNGRHAADIEAGKKAWEWDGTLAKNPTSLRQKLGGRWLTADYEAGDLLTFSMQTVHASTDNGSADRIRLSSDSRYQPASCPADDRWMGQNPVAHGRAGKRGRVC